MNNDIFRNPYKTINKDEETSAASTSETRLAVALSRIVKSRDWRVIVEQYFGPRLAGAREKADRLDGPELFRAQGEIRILKELGNLQAALEAQQNTLEHHAKEEN